MNYLGCCFDLQPSDLLLRHKGEKIAAYWMGDICAGVIMPIFFASEEDRPGMIEKMVMESIPKGLAKLDQLLGDTKYICGDMLCQYDFQVAGSILNFGMYNEYPCLMKIKPCLIKHASEKVKKYVKCFAMEMGDYMDKRTQQHKSVNKLHYFDLMGRAEPIRMILQYTGIHWADVRCTG